MHRLATIHNASGRQIDDRQTELSHHIAHIALSVCLPVALFIVAIRGEEVEQECGVDISIGADRFLIEITDKRWQIKC